MKTSNNSNSSSSRQTRHSKVCTSRGPRDRRVRLSAITAIQFYDVQDRLGFDRPSEAVDWLMLKAKASIDALPRKPIAVGVDSVNSLDSLLPMGFVPGFNYELANIDSFPMIGSRENRVLQDEAGSAGPDRGFVPGSCLDQVVFSAGLFSKKSSPLKRPLFGLSMEDGPRKHRVVDWPFVYATKH